MHDRIVVSNNPVNWVDPLGLEIIICGRNPFINIPKILRGGLRYNPPKSLPETPVNPKYVPEPVRPVEWPKATDLLDKIADLLDGSGGIGTGIGGVTTDPGGDKDPGLYDPFYNPGGMI